MPIFLCLKNPFRTLYYAKKNPSKVGGFTRPDPSRGMPYFASYPWWVAPLRCPLPFRMRCKGTANICVFQIYCVKKTETHKYSCGILRRFGFICLPLQTKVAKVGI